MSIYVPPTLEPQYRRLYFRNVSSTDLVVKLVSSKPHVLELARARLRLQPDSYLFIEAKFKYSNLGTFDYTSPKLCGYAMPIYTHTLPLISKWLNTDGVETKKQLAFEMVVKFSNTVFSARDIIIDLPGTACLIDSVPRAVPSLNGESPVDDADADTKTAVTFFKNRDIVSDVLGDREGCACSWFSGLVKPSYSVASGKTSNESRLETTQSFMLTAKSESTKGTRWSTLEREHLNIEQEATPCGGN